MSTTKWSVYYVDGPTLLPVDGVRFFYFDFSKGRIFLLFRFHLLLPLSRKEEFGTPLTSEGSSLASSLFFF